MKTLSFLRIGVIAHYTEQKRHKIHVRGSYKHYGTFNKCTQSQNFYSRTWRQIDGKRSIYSINIPQQSNVFMLQKAKIIFNFDSSTSHSQYIYHLYRLPDTIL